MLDLDHPQTRFVFEASRYEGEIHARLVHLLENPGADPTRALDEILAGPLPELRRLLRERFDDRPGIASRLDAIETAILDRRPVPQIWETFLKLSELSPDTFGTGFI